MSEKNNLFSKSLLCVLDPGRMVRRTGPGRGEVGEGVGIRLPLLDCWEPSDESSFQEIYLYILKKKLKLKFHEKKNIQAIERCHIAHSIPLTTYKHRPRDLHTYKFKI